MQMNGYLAGSFQVYIHITLSGSDYDAVNSPLKTVKPMNKEPFCMLPEKVLT